ncbi:hypothetical protein PanWU01x14_058670 [Parasponia andersonii]|uniref:Uncharacterized protein n=1 Tax=Parasponia andersonii TaxID=3476 RepID=A0A2P5DJB5_PARAD|nr:hypothetical protein PanWU01x14_058670 [Parasponia andersonii]
MAKTNLKLFVWFYGAYGEKEIMPSLEISANLPEMILTDMGSFCA